MKIRIGVVGRVLNGERAGQYVQIVDDSGETGGFYILYCAEPSFSSADVFDDWLESKEDLTRYFVEDDCSVAWLED